MTELSEWYRWMPQFTRWWLTATVGLSLLARFGVVPAHLLPLNTDLIWSDWHIWRPITATFYYPLNPNTGFHFMLLCYFLYNYSLRLETDTYKSTPADYALLLLFNWLCCLVAGWLLGLQLLLDAVVMTVLYVWCQLNKETTVSFWFGTRFKAVFLPWVLMVINVVMATGGIYSMIGIGVGHLYVFMKFKMPQELGYASYLEAPQWLKHYFPQTTGGVHGFGVPPVNQRNVQPNAGPARSNWGHGQRLGG